MLFNSVQFFVFFAAIYSLYWLFASNHKYQNRLLLVASYIFYGAWDVRFLSLLALSTIVDFFVGKYLGNCADDKTRQRLVTISVVTNLGILGVFKYFNFFAESLATLSEAFGVTLGSVTLEIVLPVGISFYTFQTMSYTIDIYRRKLNPTNDFLDFALFVSFFPQLVAGPIERARSLLPQIQRARSVSSALINAGVSLIIWGLFKKVVVADNLAPIVDSTFANSETTFGIDMLIGVVAFAFQIYCDFSGYSDIARGICKLMGFELMLNFKHPYHAVSPSDFWRRWHISLSSWLRDYLYISLGGNRLGNISTIRNLFATMLLGGLWHGASWTFVIWGAYHGLLLSVFRVFERSRGEKETHKRAAVSPTSDIPQIMFMFALTCLGWIIFRAENVGQIWQIILHAFTPFPSVDWSRFMLVSFLISPVVAVQHWQQKRQDLLVIANASPIVRGISYALLLVGIAAFGVRESNEFIYFQF